jgi:pilus assembly protein FimV
MSRKLILLGVLSLIFAPGAALSLGLGDIRLNSYLNQPMDAEITLNVSSAAELDTLRVALASSDAFRRYGLDRPAYFDDLRFEVRPTGATTAVVRVSSSRPMVEPFLTFLLEARWSGGRILREYTVLLDPPVFMPTPEAAPTPAPAPPPAVERPRPAPAPEPVARPAPTPTPAVTPRAVRSEYTVRRNDTLWQIAQQVRPDDRLTTNQVMMALFRENPNAFDGNINRLRAGAILRIPSREEMAASSVGEVNAEVRRQTDAWRAAVAPPPPERRLELAPPTETPRPPAPVADPVPAAPADELLEAVQELRSELAETRRVMELKDAEIAALQARLAELEAGTPPVEPEPEAPVAEPDPAVAAPAPTPEPVAAPAPPPAPVAPSLLDRTFALLGSLWLWLVLALVLIVGAMAVFLRKRKEEERSIEDELAETGTWGALEPTGAELAAGATAGTAAATKITPRPRTDEASIQVEETAAEPGSAPAVPPAAPAKPDKSAEEDYQYPFEDTIAGEAGINLDQSDPLAEADFHMAYGLYDQAADIIRKAVDREPDRYDLRRKLIDICFVWGNADEFLSQAQAIRERGGAEAEADWGKIAIMGRQICPGEPLFEGVEAAAVDVDLGTEASDDADVQEDIAASGSWLDFDVGESDVPMDALGDTREQPALDSSGKPKDATAEIDLEELGIDLDLGESGEYALKDLAERAPEEDEAPETETPEEADTPETAVLRKEQARPSVDEPVVELPDEEEEEDGGTMMMDVSQLPRSSEDPTQRGEGFELDEDEPTLTGAGGFEEISDDARQVSGEDPTVMGVDSGLEEEDEGDHTLVKKFTMPADEAPTKEVDTFEEDPDLDLDDLTQMLETDAASRASDDEATLAVTGVESESPVEEEIEDTREMPPSEVDEVGTKLDLARAYIDMGDPDGARSILGEVVEEGDEAQQAEARELLDSLG